MDPTIQEPTNEELHVSIEVPEESTNHGKNSENGIENSENGIENSENGIEMQPLKQQEQNAPSKSVKINVPITENELEDENQSEIPQKRQKCDDQQRGSGRDSRRMTFSSDFKRFLSPGETELDIKKFEKDVNESKSYDVSHILKLNHLRLLE